MITIKALRKAVLPTILIFLLMVAPCFAAGTVTGAVKRYQGISGTYEVAVFTYTVTFDSSNGAPANVALDSILDSDGDDLPTVAGWILFRVDIYPGTTGPTDDTDFYLWSVEDKIDVLGNNGLNAIDNATYSSVYPATASQPLTGDELFDIDNNAVNSAGTVIIIKLYR